MNKFYGAYSLCSSTRRCEPTASLLPVENAAYLSRDNVSYLVETFGYVPRPLPHGPRAVPPHRGDHQLHEMAGSALHALLWGSRRFGHDGPPDSVSHQQAFAPDGLPMFAGTGTLPATTGDAPNPVGSGAYTMWCYASMSSPVFKYAYALSSCFDENGGSLGGSPNASTATTAVDASAFILCGGSDPFEGGRAATEARFRGVTLGSPSPKGAPADYTECVAPVCRAIPLSGAPPYYLTAEAPHLTEAAETAMFSADSGFGSAGVDFARVGSTAWRFLSVDDGTGQYTIQNVCTLGYLAARDPPPSSASGALVKALGPGYVPCYPSPDGCLAHYPKAYLAPLLPFAPLRKWVLYTDGSARWTPMRTNASSGSSLLLKNVRTQEYLCLVDGNPLYGFLTTSPSNTGDATLFSLVPADDLPAGILSVDNVSLSHREAQEYLARMAGGSLPRARPVSSVTSSALRSKWLAYFTPGRSPATVPAGYTPPSALLQALLKYDDLSQENTAKAVAANAGTIASYGTWATSAGPVPGQILKPAASLSSSPDDTSGFMEWFTSFGRCFFDTFDTDAKRVSVGIWASALDNVVLHDPPTVYKKIPQIGDDLWSEIVYANQTGAAKLLRAEAYTRGPLNAIGFPGRYRPPGAVWRISRIYPTTATVRFANDVCVGSIILMSRLEESSILADPPPATVTTTLRAKGSDGQLAVTYTGTKSLNLMSFEPPNVTAQRGEMAPFNPPVSDWSWILSLETISDIKLGFGAAIARVGPPYKPANAPAQNALMVLGSTGRMSGDGVQLSVAPPNFTGDASERWWFRPTSLGALQNYHVDDYFRNYWNLLIESTDPKATAVSQDSQPGRKWLALTMVDGAKKRLSNAQVGTWTGDPLLGGEYTFFPYEASSAAGAPTYPWILQPWNEFSDAQKWSFSRSPSNGRLMHCAILDPFPEGTTEAVGFPSSVYGGTGELPVVASEAVVTIDARPPSVATAGDNDDGYNPGTDLDDDHKDDDMNETLGTAASQQSFDVDVSDLIFQAGDAAVLLRSKPSAEQRAVVYGQPAAEEWKILWTGDVPARPHGVESQGVHGSAKPGAGGDYAGKLLRYQVRGQVGQVCDGRKPRRSWVGRTVPHGELFRTVPEPIALPILRFPRPRQVIPYGEPGDERPAPAGHLPRRATAATARRRRRNVRLGPFVLQLGRGRRRSPSGSRVLEHADAECVLVRRSGCSECDGGARRGNPRNPSTRSPSTRSPNTRAAGRTSGSRARGSGSGTATRSEPGRGGSGGGARRSGLSRRSGRGGAGSSR